MVFLHVLGVVIFALGHGTSLAVAFQLKRERESPRIAALLDVSKGSTALMYIGLLVTIVAGVVLGFMGDHWGSWWLWLSIGLLVIVLGAMYAVATPFYLGVRASVGAQLDEKSRSRALERPVSLEALASSSRPMVLMLVGGIGLAVILWLMIAQPA